MKLDSNTNIFLKLALYTNVPPSSLALENFNLFMLKQVFKQGSVYSPMRYLVFILYPFFLKKLRLLMVEETALYRAQWLLLQSDANVIAVLQSKDMPKYFHELETHIFENYISNWNDVFLFSFIKNEYYKIRKLFLISFFKKYGNFIVFWFVFIFILYIGLSITARENSLTVWDLFKGWYNFLTHRLK